MLTITNSQIQCFRECQRKHHFQYNLLKVPAVEPEYFGFGKQSHTALDRFFMGRAVEEALATLKFDKAEYQAKARAMVRAYYAIYKQDEYKTIEIEEKYSVEIPNIGLTHQGIIDKLVEKDGQLFLVDHKTTSMDIEDPSSMYWKKLMIDNQISGYKYMVEKKVGRKVGIIYDVLKKHSSRGPKQKIVIRQRKDEDDQQFELRKCDNMETVEEYEERMYQDYMASPGSYFIRREVARTSDEQAQWEKEMICTAMDIASAKVRDVHPRNQRACVSEMHTCPYFSVCAGLETIDSDNFRTKSQTHEEYGKVPF